MMSTIVPGLVSVVLVNFRGADDTIHAIERLRQTDWPRDLLEIVVVENASGDDSAERIRAMAHDVVFVQSNENRGFAGGCNLGVSASHGEYVAFLNNDAKPAPGWISAAILRFARSPGIGAVASKVLDWDGNLVDYIGSGLTWFGMGYKPLTTEPPPPQKLDVSRDVLFGTGAAMFVRRDVFDLLGGFDERFFMFFEDVDFGWRLNLLGWRFAYEPASIAFHKHHASMAEFGEFKEQYLLERNALFALYKNLGPEKLAEALPATLALAIRRSIAKSRLDSSSFDLRIPGGDSVPELPISKAALAGVFAVDQFVAHLPELKEARDAIQATRVVSDSRLWRLFGRTDVPALKNRYYTDGYEKIVTAFDVLTNPVPQKVLIITGDPIGAKLAGPAIRAWNMAQNLANSNTVTLLTLSGAEAIDAPFDIVHVRAGADREFARWERWADIIVFQGHAMAVFDALRTTRKIVVVDIYDPMHLEQLEQGKELEPAVWNRQVQDATDVLNQQLLRGDFFLCASERQRHFYLGQLAALGRINPANYMADPHLAGLIAVVSFGLPSQPPVHGRRVLKGVLPGISLDDKVLLWGGGLYNWFDPLTLIRAVHELSSRRSNVRLFFQGTQHPHPGVPEMAIVAESRSLAEELGALDTTVFFNSSWVDYTDRQNYLLESDAGVSTHFAHIETTFSFRTRILDYLWAELPMVVTAGDHFAELIEKEVLGVVVAPGDVESLVTALEKVLFDASFRKKAIANIRRVRVSYQWDRVLEPLADFVAAPHLASDRKPGSGGHGRRRRASGTTRRSGILFDLGRATFYLRNGGPVVVIRKIRRRFTDSR
jgi:GT2 family glycosyltransferase